VDQRLKKQTDEKEHRRGANYGVQSKPNPKGYLPETLVIDESKHRERFWRGLRTIQIRGNASRQVNCERVKIRTNLTKK